MTRVAVIGNAGGGKSTLSRIVAEAHGLPVVELDHLLWQPGWTQADPEALRRQHADAIASDRWLIDGYGPWDLVPQRLDRADTIIFVDHPLPVHLWWATKRQIRSLFTGAEGPPGCAMWRMTWPLFRMMVWLHREVRPKLLSEIAARRDLVRVIHLTSPAQLRCFAENPV